MIGKIVGAGTMGLVGILLIVLGFLIRNRGRIDLFQAYYTERIATENKYAFCRLSGTGVLLIGSSLVITAVVWGITASVRSFLVFAAGLTAGLILLVCAGKAYKKK